MLLDDRKVETKAPAKTIVVRVTEEHIRRGQVPTPYPRSESCPIALAMLEITGKGWRIGGSVAILEGVCKVRLPESAARFVVLADVALEGREPPPQPFTFTLTLP